MKLSSKPVMMPGARCRLIDLFQRSDVLQSWIWSQCFCLVTDCAACKQDTLSLHLIYSSYKYFHGNCPLDWFHLEREEKLAHVTSLSLSFSGSSPGSSCWANSIYTIYFATAVSPVFIPDLSPLNPSYMETSALKTETLSNSLWGCPLHISGSI